MLDLLLTWTKCRKKSRFVDDLGRSCDVTLMFHGFFIFENCYYICINLHVYDHSSFSVTYVILSEISPTLKRPSLYTGFNLLSPQYIISSETICPPLSRQGFSAPMSSGLLDLTDRCLLDSYMSVKASSKGSCRKKYVTSISDFIRCTSRRLSVPVVNFPVMTVPDEDLSARSRYQGQEQVITSHSLCGM